MYTEIHIFRQAKRLQKNEHSKINIITLTNITIRIQRTTVQHFEYKQ